VFTSEIEGGVEALRNGNFPLPETGHTVVLGAWRLAQSMSALCAVSLVRLSQIKAI